MGEEIDLDLNSDLDSDEEKQRNDRELKRNKDLSDKLKAEGEARAKAEAERESAVKEADFFKNFNPLVSKYQGAGEYQEQIKERVLKGYDVEEATVAVLAKEGKYTPPVAPEPPKDSPAGGSAINTMNTGGDKSLEDMSRDEKREALEQAIAKGQISIG